VEQRVPPHETCRQRPGVDDGGPYAQPSPHRSVRAVRRLQGGVPKGVGTRLMAGATDRFAVRIDHVAKSFAGNRVLRDVSFSVRRGEIHALLGTNGSGEAALLKILAGVHRGDRGGSVVVYEREIAADRTTAAFARASGLRFVHQDLAIFPSLSVAENVAVRIRYDTAWPSRIDRRRLAQRVECLL